MNKNDFQQLNELRTPEAWLNNAIDIPNQNIKSKSLLTKTHIISAAAVLVVAVLAAVTVFSLFGRESGLSTQPKLEPPFTVSTSPTEAEARLVTTPEGLTAVAIIADESHPFGSFAASMNPSSGSSEPAFVDRTESAETAAVATHTEAKQPTHAATTSETGSQGYDEPPETTYPADEPDICTDETDPNPMFEPTESAEPYFAHYIYVTVSEYSEFSGIRLLYCHIIDSNGDSQTEMYSSSERYQIRDNSGRFNPSPYQRLKQGSYTVLLYDKNGVTFSYQVYLGESDIYLNFG